MQYDGWLETLLYARFPKHDLVIRNLGFSGDEIATRLRSKNFGTPDEWLSGQAAPIGGYEENRFAGTNTKADVIFAFFGYNESYAGEAGLAGVQAAARRLDHAHACAEVQRQVRAADRALLADRARRPAQSRSAGRQGEQRSGSSCTRRRWRRSRRPQRRHVRRSVHADHAAVRRRRKSPLTINGVHLNAEGNRRIARGDRPRAVRRAAGVRAAYLAALRQAVRRQELSLVQPLPRHRRLRDLRRSRLSDVCERQYARPDRARTIAVAIDAANGPDAIVSPGHVFPLVARPGGVLVRAGHTEAAVDVSRLAGLNSERRHLRDHARGRRHGASRRPDGFCPPHELKIGTIRDLIAYRLKKDHFVEHVATAPFIASSGAHGRPKFFATRPVARSSSRWSMAR